MVYYQYRSCAQCRCIVHQRTMHIQSYSVDQSHHRAGCGSCVEVVVEALACGVIGALSAFYNDGLDLHDPKQRHLSAIRQGLG